MLTSYELILFDAGGTLFRPFPSVGEIYSQTAARYGCHADAEHLEKLFRTLWLKRDGLSHIEHTLDEKTERQWWSSLVKDVFDQVGGVDDFEGFFQELYDLFASSKAWRVFPDVMEVLATLKQGGKKLGMVSNWDSRLFQICEGLGVTDYFDFILASAVFGAAKPNPDIFKEALKKGACPAEKAVHIGDSYKDDIQGATAVGIDAILIHRSDDKRDLSASEGSRIREISSLKELL